MKKIGLLLLLLPLLLVGCNKMTENDIWREKIYISDDIHVMVYHSHHCKGSKPFFKSVEPIISHQKLKFDGYCYCLSNDTVLLMSITKRNYRGLSEYAYTSEDFSFLGDVTQVIDTITNGEYIYFGYDDRNDKIVEIKPINASSLVMREKKKKQ